MIGSNSYEAELHAAVKAVRAAAKLCQEVQATIERGVLKKPDRSPVTVADFGSQAIVCKTLADSFPSDPVVGEESAAALREPGNEALRDKVVFHASHHLPGSDQESVLNLIDRGGHDATENRFWTLDPIDGTKGFLRGEQYAIALALIEDGDVKVAALCCPNLKVSPTGGDEVGVVYGAVLGAGVSVHSLDSGKVLDSKTSTLTDATKARFVESVESGHSSHDDAADVASDLGITAPSLRLDSQAKYAVVARGEADIYLRLPTRPGYIERIWDHAAGMLVIEESGGRVTDIDGNRLDFTKGRGLENNRGVVATNGHLHARVLEALQTSGVAA